MKKKIKIFMQKRKLDWLLFKEDVWGKVHNMAIKEGNIPTLEKYAFEKFLALSHIIFDEIMVLDELLR